MQNLIKRWLLNKQSATILAIFVASFLIRLIYLNQLQSLPTFENPTMDEGYHVQVAEKINSGEGFGTDPFYRAPLYLYFLAGLFNITSGSIYWVRLIQILIGSLIPILMFFLGTRVFDRRVGYGAAIVAIVYPTLLYYDAALLITSLMVLLTTGLALQLYRCEDNPTITNFVLAGAILGLAGLARPNILLLGPVLFLWAWWKLKPSLGWKRTLILYFTIGLVSLAVILPVTVRNYVVSGEFVFIAWQGGFNFFIGNNRKASGWAAEVEGIDLTWEGGYRESIAFAEKAIGRKLKKTEVSEFWYDAAFKEISVDPSGWVGLLIKKARLIINGYEIPNNQNLYVVRDAAPIIAPLMFNSGLFFPFGLIAPLAILGLGLSVRHWRKLMLVYLVAGSYLGSLLLFFVCARFRMPVIPIFIILAVYACIELYRFVRDHDYKNLALVVLLLGVLVVESNHDMLGINSSEQQATDHYMAGNALLKQDKLTQAELEFRKAVAIDSTFGLAYNNLGIIKIRQQLPWEAERYYKKAIVAKPTLYEPYVNLAAIYEKRGEFLKAIPILEQARIRFSLNDMVHFKLGACYYAVGRYEKSMTLINEAIRLNPNNSAAQSFRRQMTQ